MTVFIPLGLGDFILPECGGGVIHQAPDMSENIWLPVPTENVGELWYRHDKAGELFGGQGNGIVGNGRIAASTYNGPWDNLIIYDYYGNQIWSSGFFGEDSFLNLATSASSPMVDKKDRVVACDNDTILMVNASNFDDVHLEWVSPIPSAPLFRSQRIPISPAIVENKTIILPMSKGPLLAYDAETGEKIAEIKLGENTTFDPYWGIPEMNWTDYIQVRSDYEVKSICPYRYNSTSNLIEWSSSVPYGIMPIKRNVYFDTNPLIYYFAINNNVTAIKREGILDWTILASNNIESGGIITGEGYFSTINSATVEGNMIYLVTEYNKPGYWPYFDDIFNHTIGRLYALNVSRDDTNGTVDLIEEWNYTYFGKSQASATLINDTLYFDGYNNTAFVKDRDPQIYAVYTNGTEKWRISYPNMTWFTFTTDPRGGFWYHDCDPLFRISSGGNKLVRFYEENGSIWEELDMKTLLNDTGDNKDLPVLPASDMTIGGTATHPIMLISANHPNFKEGKWVLAINLSDNNTVIWKVPIKSTLDRNYAHGDYTILTEHNQSRVLFPTNIGGVYGIGTHPDCWFEDMDYEPIDSPDDDNTIPDSVNIIYTINTSMLYDKIMIRAILYAKAQDGHPAFPIRYRYMEKRNYNITKDQPIQDTITIPLPKNAPQGDYNLNVFLYNSSGEINNFVELKGNEWLEKFDTGYYANDSYNVSDLPMHPPNDPPEKPDTPDGDQEVHVFETDIYSTSTWDRNEDRFRYQWKWKQSSIINFWQLLTYSNNETHYRLHTWWPPIADDTEVRVRAADIHNSPNVMSNWSDPLAVTMSQGCFISAPAATLLYQSTKFTAMSSGLSEPLTHSWDFTGSRAYTAGYPIHNYTFNSTNDYVVRLQIIDNNGVEVYYNRSIIVDYIIANFTNTPISVQPNETMYFNDTSLTYNESHIVNWTWNFDDGNVSYTQNTTHVYLTDGDYNVTLTVIDNQSHTDMSYKIIYVDLVPPDILYSTYSPYFIVCGSNVTIYADFFDNQSGIKTAKVNITNPDISPGNFTMYHSENSPYDYEYEFNDTWQDGQYNITIWVQDYANNSNSTTGYWFIVSPMFPDNDAVNITTHPTLSVHIDDPNDEAVNVSFYEWTPNSYIIDSESEWNEGNFTNTTTDNNGSLQLVNDTSIFGDGSDGDVTIPPGTTTLTGDMNYHNLTIPSSRTLNTAGYTVYVSGTLLNSGTITDSSSGGSGGTSGDGGSGQDPWENSGGPATPEDGNCGNTGTGRGGTGGAGGAGGGGAKAELIIIPYTEVDADGGNGGDGGSGGTGGGEVILYARRLDNQGVIHADGGDGQVGSNGQSGEYYTWGAVIHKDLAGGGGGGGSGGNGGDGGFVNITSSEILNLNESGIHAIGGSSGNNGQGGDGYQCSYANYAGWDWWKFNGSTSCDFDTIGKGGEGEYVQNWYSDDGEDGSGASGANGSVSITSHYVPFGNYSKILDTGVVVGWSNLALDQTMPDETSITVSYGENISDSWSYYDDLSSVPDCRWLKVILTLSTTNYSISPVVNMVNISSSRYLLNTVTNVSDGSYAEFNWTGLDLNALYYWQVRLFNEISSSYGPVWGFNTIENRIFELSSIYSSPDTVGFGFNVDIFANLTDNNEDVSSVSVNISYPDDSSSNFSMSHTDGDTYEYVFDDTWLVGQYDYTIWAVDTDGNSTSDSGNSFNVSANATINIATLKDTYGAGEYINITDPPGDGDGEGDGSNNNDSDDTPDNQPIGGDIELVESNYFSNKWYNSSSGEYTFMSSQGVINYYRNGEWNPIDSNFSLLPESHPAYALGYRVYNNKGVYSTYFKPNIQDTWPIGMVYKGDSPTIHTLRSEISGIGYLDPSQDNRYEVLQTPLSSQGSIVNNTATYQNIFTGASLVLKYRNIGLKEYLFMSNTTKDVLVANPPSSFGLSNQDSYLVVATKLDYTGLQLEHNGTIYTSNFTVIDGQINLKTAEGVVEIAFPVGKAFEYNYDENGNREYRDMLFRFIQYQGDNYLLSGIKVTELNQLEFPVVLDPTTFGPRSVSQSSDDAEENTAHTTFDSNDPDIELQAGKEGYFRWEDITIPPDSGCTNAYMQAESKVGAPSDGRDVIFKIYCINETNTTTFTVVDKGSARPLTDNFGWDNSTYSFISISYATRTWGSGTNLKLAVTEVLNETYNNWESNNSIAFAFIDEASESGGGEDIGTWDHPGGEPWGPDPSPPRIYISYLLAGNVPPEEPLYPYPVNNSYPVEKTPTLSVYLEDRNGDELTAYWYHNATQNVLTAYYRPESNGSWTNLTAVGASENWDCVEEDPKNDGDYVSAPDNTMQYDLYNFTNNSGVNTGEIYSVKVKAFTGVGRLSIPPLTSKSQFVMKNTSITYGDVNVHTGGGVSHWSYVSQTWTTNPETSQPWTWGDIDNFEFGIGLQDVEYDAYCTQIYIEVSYLENEGTWHLEGTTTGHDGLGENATWVMDGSNESYTDYWWYVKSYDGVFYNQSKVFHFKTGTFATDISTTPLDGDYNITSPVDLNVTFTTPEGMAATIYWYSWNYSASEEVELSNTSGLGNGTYTYQWDCGNGTRDWYAIVDVGNFTNATDTTVFYCDDVWSDDFWGTDYISGSSFVDVGDSFVNYSGDWMNLDGNYVHSYSDNTFTVENAFNETGLILASPFDPEVSWFILDLGVTRNVVSLRGRSNDIRDPIKVDVYVNDSTTFSESDKVASNINTWQDTSTWVEYDSTDRVGRYVNVTVTDGESLTLLWWGKSSPTYFSPFDVNTIAIAGNLTSTNISLPSNHYWSHFNADYTTDITFSILNGTDNSILLSGLTGNNDDISSLSPLLNSNATVKLFANFSGEGASLDSWSISWTAVGTSVDTIVPYSTSDYPLNITASGPGDIENVTLWYRYSPDNVTFGDTGYKVQRGITKIASADLIVTQTIETVNDIDNAFVLCYPSMRQIDKTPAATGTNPNKGLVSAYLKDDSTIEFQKSTTGANLRVDWQVIECFDDEFYVQRGEKILTAETGTSITDTIPNGVDASKSMAWHTIRTTYTSAGAAQVWQFQSNVTASTTITFDRFGSTAITGALRWSVITWNTDKIDSFQVGDTTDIDEETDAAPMLVALGTTIDTSDSMLLFQSRAGSLGAKLEESTCAGYIKDEDEIGFYHYSGAAGDDTRTHWYVIDFGDDCGSKQVNIHDDNVLGWSGEDYTLNPAIALNRTLSFVSLSCDDHNFGTVRPRHTVTSNISSTTNLRTVRNTTGQEVEISWQILELPFTAASGTSTDWIVWNDASNPDTTYPWSWDFDFPYGNGYYEFFSHGACQGYYEEYASVADARCFFIPIKISDPYPSDGSVGVEISPTLNIAVSHDEGKNMSITWYSNSSGSWLAFGSNSSVGNGTYHQDFVNASMNGQWWFWKVDVSDGVDFVVSNVFKFYTGCESKIVNTGSYDFSGFLLMQVQYNDSGEWVVDTTVVNDSLKVINSSEQLALDQFFNGEVNTDDLSYGDGMYRVYVAFRDPYGNVLQNDDESYLETWAEFDVTFE